MSTGLGSSRDGRKIDNIRVNATNSKVLKYNDVIEKAAEKLNLRHRNEIRNDQKIYNYGIIG